MKNKRNIIGFLIIVLILIVSIFINKNTESEIKWFTYTDNRYGYSIDFPDYVNVSTVYEKVVVLSQSLGGGSFVINGGVSFGEADLDNYGRIRVTVFENTEFKNTNEWLVAQNKTFDYPRKYLEKEISIDGYNAIVVHEMGGISKQTEEHFWNEKTAVFVKDGTLFEIDTRYGLGNEESSEHEKVWSSFKFLDENYN